MNKQFDLQLFGKTTSFGYITQEDVDTIASFKLIVNNLDSMMSSTAIAALNSNTTGTINVASLTNKVVTDSAVVNFVFGTAPIICHATTIATDAATADKTCSVNGAFALIPGARVAVLMGNTNTAANPTLNVNNTGAKAMYYRGYPIAAQALRVNTWYDFIYDGVYWVCMTPLVFTT